MNEHNIINRVKNHVKENKSAYIAGGVCLLIGSVGTALAFHNANISIANPAIVNYKPIANTIQVSMTRPGPKSFIVQCLEDQKTWPSLRQAAKDLNVNPSELSKHLKGGVPAVNGLHFEKLGEV